MRVFSDETLKYSQNFLYNKKLVNKIINKTNLNNNDTVIEIGAGKGCITEALIKNTYKIIAIEKDNNLFKELKFNFKNIENIKLLNQDILEHDFSKYNNYKIISNIPFYITTKIINKILSINNKPTDMFLILQKEAAERYVGEPYKKESLKSIFLKIFYDVKIIYKFNKSDFKPMPNVNIVFVHFNMNQKIDLNDINLFKNFITYLFMINKNILKTKLNKIFTYHQIKNISKKINIDQKITEIQFEQWLYLFKIFKTEAPMNSKKTVQGYYNKYIKIQSKLDKNYKSRKN